MRNTSRMVAWLLSVILLSVTLHSSASALEAPRMPKEELKAKLGSPSVVVIDLRAVTDWLMTKKKIKTAVRENPREPEQWISRYPKDKTIVLYCA